MFHADRHIGRNVIRRVELIELDDSGTQQKARVRGLQGETFELAMRGQYFGASGTPPAGAEGHVFLAGGRPDQAFFMGIEHKDHRPKDLGAGEKVIYNAHGEAISLVKQHIRMVGEKISLTANEVEITGKIKVTGDIEQAGKLTSTGPHVASAHV